MQKMRLLQSLRTNPACRTCDAQSLHGDYFIAPSRHKTRLQKILSYYYPRWVCQIVVICCTSIYKMPQYCIIIRHMQIEQPPRILQVPCAHLRVDIAIGLVFVITVGIGAWQFDAPVSKLVSALDAILQVLRRSVSIAQGKADAWRSKEPIMKGIMINHKLIYWCREVDYSGWVGRETKQLSLCNLYTQNIKIGMSQRTLCSDSMQ